MKIAILITALLTSLSAIAAETRVVLRYQMGNQAKESEVVVLSDGLILAKDRSLLTWEYLPNKRLGEIEIRALITAIDSAKVEGVVSVTTNLPALHGGQFGSLEAYTSDGSTAFVYALARDDQNPQVKRLLCLSGDRADHLRQFIQSVATMKLPLDEFPCK